MLKILIIVFETIGELIDDTLKRDKDKKRRFSKTALTMFTAWVYVSYVFIDDYIKNGFRMESFLAMLGVATGMKITDAISKKVNHKNNSQ